MDTSHLERWDTWLVYEHELIERAMAVLAANLDALERREHDPVQTLRAVDFLAEFGDRIHNAKEEQHLFPLMERRGVPVQGGPLGVMLAEHEAERGLLARLAADLPNVDVLSPGELRDLADQARDYLRIRAEHIWKENDVLYAMARRVFTEEDAASLTPAFRAADEAAYGPDFTARFVAMVQEAEADRARTRLVERLSPEQLHGIMETLPFEVTFVDAEDTVAYFNRLDKKKIFPRTRSVIGRRVDKCHPAKSVDTVQAIVQGFKDGTRDSAEFWIDFAGDKVLIRYFPVRGDDGEYLGVLEVTQEIGRIQGLTGQKRLLD